MFFFAAILSLQHFFTIFFILCNFISAVWVHCSLKATFPDVGWQFYNLVPIHINLYEKFQSHSSLKHSHTCKNIFLIFPVFVKLYQCCLGVDLTIALWKQLFPTLVDNTTICLNVDWKVLILLKYFFTLRTFSWSYVSLVELYHCCLGMPTFESNFSGCDSNKFRWTVSLFSFFLS